MSLLPRFLSASRRTAHTVDRSRSQKPRLESLEERALLSANPATLHYRGELSAAVSSHSTVMISGADSSHVATSDLLSLNAINGGHARGGMIQMSIRHVVAK